MKLAVCGLSVHEGVACAIFTDACIPGGPETTAAMNASRRSQTGQRLMLANVMCPP